MKKENYFTESGVATLGHIRKQKVILYRDQLPKAGKKRGVFIKDAASLLH